MANPISQKLKIRPGDRLLTLHAPAAFKKGLQGLPPGVKISDRAKEQDQVHWFVYNQADIEKNLNAVLKMLKPGVMVWTYYPKQTSKIQTDLNRDKGWDSLMKHSDKLAWVNLISFDDTWSVFGFRAKTEADKKRAAKPKPEREIYKWANPDTKEVRLPEDFESALKKNKKIRDYFNALAYSNRREWVEWIITAKREETRNNRVKESLIRMDKGWKNPANN